MKQDPFPRLQSVIGLTVLGMVLLSALALGANRPVSWTLLSLGVTLVFFLQVMLALFTSQKPLALRKALLPGVLFLGVVIWAWVQATPGLFAGFAHPVWTFVPEAVPAISADPGQGRHAVLRLLCYAMVFVVMLLTCVNAERAGVVLKGIALFSSALALFGLYAFATGNNPILGDASGRGIVNASFVNRNSYATYAGFGVLANIAAYLLVTGRGEDSFGRRLERFFVSGWIYALGALLCLGALSLTQSRAGAGAGIFGLLVFLSTWMAGQRGRGVVLPLVILAVLIFIGTTSATGLLERMIATDATDGRFTIYPSTLEAIRERPLLGHGLGSFYDAFRAYVPLEGAQGETLRAHSTYLELAFGLGLPAAGAFLLAQVLIAWRLWRGSVKRRRGRVFSCFALGCLALAALHSGFDFSLQIPAVGALFAAILALGFAQSFTKAELENTDTKSRVRD